jgi:hypothetical protein
MSQYYTPWDAFLTTFSFSRGVSSQNQGDFELQGDFKVRDGVKLKWILVWCNESCHANET